MVKTLVLGPALAGLRVMASVGPLTVKVVHDNKVAARHALLRTRSSDPRSPWNTIWTC